MIVFKKALRRVISTGYFQSFILKMIEYRTEPVLRRDDLSVFFRRFPLPAIDIHFKINFLLEYCRNKKVAHFGFVDYPFTKESFRTDVFLHGQLKKVAALLIGLDINAEAVKFYAEQTGDVNVRVADVYALEPHAGQLKECDVFLFGELLEHLDNAGKALQSVAAVMPDTAVLVVTVPNALCLNVFGCALHDVELVHPDHVAWYSPNTLVALGNRHGFTLDYLCFYQCGKGEKIDEMYRKYPYLADGIIGVFRKQDRIG
ncbi:MAG: hypothetical protein JXA18_08825 [Chitinispirillaceae bacterium]|nr:hypothetical protein [Chitinispirillaceae bacterium]